MADTEGFEEFYTATVGRLLGQLYPVTGDLHEAEEVVQEAFARASTEAGGTAAGGPARSSALVWRWRRRPRSAARFMATRRTQASGRS